MNAVPSMPAFFDEGSTYIPRSTASSSPEPALAFYSLPTEEATLLSRFEKDELQAKIEQLGGLPAGWDGQDALAISREAKESALQLVEVLTSPIGTPLIRATTNGTIEFFWLHAGGEAILEIGRSTFSVVCDREARPPLLFNGSIANGELSQSVVQLLSVGFGIAETHSITQNR